MWCYISVDVRMHQKHVERHALDTINHLNHLTTPPHHTTTHYQPPSQATASALQQLQSELAANGTSHWHSLLYHLVAKYHDGYRIDDFHAESIDPVALFYPYEWLKDVGFWGERGMDPDWTQKNCKQQQASPRSTAYSLCVACFYR